MSSNDFARRISNLYEDNSNFETLALDIFRYQGLHNLLYKSFLDHLNIKPYKIAKVSEIPFLPIEFFKNNLIQTGDWQSKMQFKSSGTGGTQSIHQVRNGDFYLQNTIKGFEHFFGQVKDYCFLALLPSYLEREASSLVYMIDHFIKLSKFDQSGFYLNEFEDLHSRLVECMEKKIPTILFGVPFGLLDFGEWKSMNLSEIVIFETGGMKGKREELTKSVLYETLDQYFQPKAIYSEYGMTEMFSQAYAIENGRFKAAPSMDVKIREINDPFNYLNFGRIGAINVIDLANFSTLSFIATDDIGRQHEDGTFEILGRIDNSDLRGCNLLVQEQ